MNLKSIGFGVLKGIIKSSATYFLEPQKGKKNITFQEPRKRGRVTKKRGISKEQTCVLVAYDRKSKTAGRGRISAMEIDG